MNFKALAITLYILSMAHMHKGENANASDECVQNKAAFLNLTLISPQGQLFLFFPNLLNLFTDKMVVF